MSRTVVIHQPDFLPYLGFFHRFLYCDLWVIFDDVQFLSGSKSFHNRDRIKTAKGADWVTVAVQKCPRGTNINKVSLSKNVDWRQNSLNKISFNYRKAPFFEEVFPHLVELYDYQCERLVDFNLESIRMLMKLFAIEVESVLSSSLRASGKKTGLLLDILKKVNAAAYLSGSGARDYLNPELFSEAGIELLWQDFKHPEYPQIHGGFEPYLSSIDLLFNCGVEQSREILRGSA